MKDGTLVRIGKRSLKLTHLDKVLYPAAGFTKGEVIDYYTRAAPSMLPHLKDRPLTLLRYPDGVEGSYFFEKECPAGHPPWLASARIESGRGEDPVNFCLVNDLPSLVWVANLASLEMHVLLARAEKIDSPTEMVFDLDPGPGADILDCARVALWLQECLETLRLKGFPKTSGGKGLHVYVPLNTPASYEKTKDFAEAAAGIVERRHPGAVTTNMRKDLRRGKVFVDWSQNSRHKSTVCVYSLRAREHPFVSTPLSWKEVEQAARKKKASLLTFEAGQVLSRIEKKGDLFSPVLELKQKLPTL